MKIIYCALLLLFNLYQVKLETIIASGSSDELVNLWDAETC